MANALYVSIVLILAIMLLILVGLLFSLILLAASESKIPNMKKKEVAAHNFLEAINKKTEENQNKVAIATWAYESNLTEENLQNELAVSAEAAKDEKETWLRVLQYDWRKFSDYKVRRQFQLYSVVEHSALPEDKFVRLRKSISDMTAIYAKAKICDFKDEKKCDLAIEPDLTNILAKSRDPDELSHVWLQWRNSVGPKCKSLFVDYVNLSNEAARMNNFSDNSEYWLHSYEVADMKQQVQDLWEQLRPLYLQIHAYVRFELRKKYGELVSEKGPIPAHLLGNMWSQSWLNVADFTMPYTDVENVDLTTELVKQNYTVTKIFRTAEEFFKSINLTEMPETFWKNSILSKPSDRDIVCHASAWDFYDRKDFRIKQCTGITIEDFVVAHHEMGHIEYYLQYKDQPVKFRVGANDGFHEAVGDLIALSVQSTKHLRMIGLTKSDTENPKIVLNNLYKVGLDKITFLPFGYLMDLWRWDVFSGKTTPENYNCRWWELREKYQGVEPPVDRSEDDFDPAAKYHIISDVPYLRYFISFVVQFQFHRALCKKAGQYEPHNPSKPLHECDIYQNTEAGNALKKMLSMGASRPWPDAMQALTGQRNMDASGLLEYFKPLQDWLVKKNEKNGAHIGWEKTKRLCVSTKKELEAKKLTN